MLTKINILTKDENKKIQKGLSIIESYYLNGKWKPDIKEFEDIHSAIEQELTNIIGETGKKIHTARSRNDQVITDVRLWIKESIQLLLENLMGLQQKLIDLAEHHVNTVMPGYSHLQRAQPISLAFHLLAYVEMFERDKRRFNFSLSEADECVLGSGALAGSTIELDRDMTAKELGFSKVSTNALDSVSNRDFILDFLHSCNLTMMHLTRFCEELILWSSTEWNFIRFDAQFTTGSSLMPQKQNPDMAEIIRGKSGRVFGNYNALLTVLKSLPLSYNRDLQEDKEGMFDSFNSLNNSLTIFGSLMESIVVNKDKFVKEIDGSYMLSTDLADYLVRKGVAFRETHHIVRKLVKYASDNEKRLDQIEIEDYKKFCDLFEDDLYEYLSAEKCLENKRTIGSPNPQFVKTSIQEWKKVLSKS
jgi:argininosuccinate lyase